MSFRQLPKDEKRHEIKKFAVKLTLYILGFIILAFGITFAINSNLGISPVNSLPFAISAVTGIRMGICVTAVLIFYMLLQIILLRKEFRLIDFTQILISVIFGLFVDGAIFIMGDFSFPTYAGQLAMLAISITLVAFGLPLYLDTNLMRMPIEALTFAIVKKLQKSSFHQVKVIMDCTLVLIAAALTYFVLGEVVGVREGTVLSAIFIGKLIPFNRKILIWILRKLGVYELIYNLHQNLAL